jgi:Domain of unknown function (DUF4252)
MRKTITLATVLLVLAASAAWGQNQTAQKLTDQPGYVPLDQLDLFPRDKLSVEINIEGALMSLVAAAAKQEDPEFSSLMAGLKAITVQAIPLKGLDEGALRTKIGRTVRWLEDRGWKSTMRVRDKGEETYIYLREIDGKIAGLTLLALQPGEEAVVINIVGRIDPAQLGRLSQSLDLPHLKQVPAPAPGKKPE